MARFFINHITEYQYSNIIAESAFKIRLYPIIDEYLQIINHTLSITFHPVIETYSDFNNNIVGTFSVAQLHDKFIIESYLEVFTSERPFPIVSNDIKGQWEKLNSLKYDMSYFDYLKYTPFNGDETFIKVLEKIKISTKTPLDVSIKLCEYIYNTFSYTKDITNVNTTVEEVWKLQAGVCQDFTHVLIQLLRKASIPAKYVSGYICANNNGLIGDGATHAWVEAYIPEYGWLGLDPTNNCIVGDKHVRIATGRDYFDCSPVEGIYRGNATSKLNVEVQVRYEDIKHPVFHFVEDEGFQVKKNSYIENLKSIQEQQQQQ